MIELLALAIVLLSIMMILAKNPINSAFCLVMLMLCLGGIYAAIGAHFVAALQVIVYAGAVMVLVVFSIMLMNLNEERGFGEMYSPTTIIATLATMGLFAVLAAGFIDWHAVGVKPPLGPYTLDTVKQLGGNVFALSSIMFAKGYMQFELIGLMLPVAVAGALVLAKRKVD